jgi:hypothetical protein
MNLISYTTNETIRPATLAEALDSLEAARIDGGAGIIEADGIACYVDATEHDIADELRAAAYDDAETFGREVAQ